MLRRRPTLEEELATQGMRGDREIYFGKLFFERRLQLSVVQSSLFRPKPSTLCDGKAATALRLGGTVGKADHAIVDEMWMWLVKGRRIGCVYVSQIGYLRVLSNARLSRSTSQNEQENPLESTLFLFLLLATTLRLFLRLSSLSVFVSFCHFVTSTIFLSNM